MSYNRALAAENKALHEEGLKRCSVCKHAKPLSEYQKGHTRSLHGLSARCKDCILDCNRTQKGTARPRGRQRYTAAERADHTARGIKWCPRCETLKPVPDFAGAHYCRICRVRSQRMTKYGLTYAEVVELESVTSCPGCLRDFDEVEVKRHFDHCHKTGRFRRVLCGDCNVILGIAKDNAETLKRLAQFV